MIRATRSGISVFRVIGSKVEPVDAVERPVDLDRPHLQQLAQSLRDRLAHGERDGTRGDADHELRDVLDQLAAPAIEDETARDRQRHRPLAPLHGERGVAFRVRDLELEQAQAQPRHHEHDGEAEQDEPAPQLAW